MVTFGTCTCSYSENKSAAAHSGTTLRCVYLGVVVKTRGSPKLGAIAADLLLNIHFSKTDPFEMGAVWVVSSRSLFVCMNDNNHFVTVS